MKRIFGLIFCHFTQGGLFWLCTWDRHVVDDDAEDEDNFTGGNPKPAGFLKKKKSKKEKNSEWRFKQSKTEKPVLIDQGGSDPKGWTSRNKELCVALKQQLWYFNAAIAAYIFVCKSISCLGQHVWSNEI